MLVCALVSQSVKYKALCFSVTYGKLLYSRASFEILDHEISYSMSQHWYIVIQFLERISWIKQTETEL